MISQTGPRKAGVGLLQMQHQRRAGLHQALAINKPALLAVPGQLCSSYSEQGMLSQQPQAFLGTG
jgi:hypothetical protein